MNPELPTFRTLTLGSGVHGSGYETRREEEKQRVNSED